MLNNTVYKDNLFKDKVLLMSGGTSKMLLQAAEDFISLGGSVALLSRKPEELEKAANNLNNACKSIRARGYKADVRKTEELEKAVDDVIRDFGRIDILINGAAGNFLSNAEKLSTNGFRTVLEIDTLGTFNLSKTVYNKWFGKNGGSIINISASLHYLGTLMQVHSSSAKAAVDATTRVLSLEWGPKGVRVNGVAPGSIEGTEGFDRLGDPGKANSKENLKKVQNDDVIQKLIEDYKSIVPLQRLGTKKDVSNAILFLGSEASSYITGQTILVDGGQLAVMPNYMVFNKDFKKLWRAKF